MRNAVLHKPHIAGRLLESSCSTALPLPSLSLSPPLLLPRPGLSADFFSLASSRRRAATSELRGTFIE